MKKAILSLLVLSAIAVNASAAVSFGESPLAQKLKTNTTAAQWKADLGIGGSSFYTASPDLTGLAIVAPYDAADAGAANWGASSGQTSQEWLVGGHSYRIRQVGTIQRAKFYLASKTGMSGLFVKVWRKIGSTYSLVGTSADILGSTTGGALNTVTINIPGAQEGDFYGMRVVYSSASAQNFYAHAATSTMYLVNNTTPTTTGYPWESQSATTTTAVPVELYMTSPIAVFAGDSIAAGHQQHYSYVETGDYNNLPGSMPWQVAQEFGWTYQNWAIGGTYLTNVNLQLPRIVAMKPKYVVIHSGRNDVTGSTSENQFTNQYNFTLSTLVAAGITPVVSLMMGGDDMVADRSCFNCNYVDLYNASLVKLINDSYPSAIIANPKPYVNTNAPAYLPATNLYAFRAEFGGDTVHPSPIGYRSHAQCVINAIRGEPSRAGVATATDSIRVGPGNMEYPSITFKDDPDTGFFWNGPNQMSLTVGKLRKWDWLANGDYVTAADGGNNIGQDGANRPDAVYARSLLKAGTLYGVTNLFFGSLAADPSPLPVNGIWYNSTTSKLRKSENSIASNLDTTGGSGTAAGVAGSIQWNDGANAFAGDSTLTYLSSILTAPRVYASGGSDALPSFSATGDPDTGIRMSGANEVFFSLGGLRKMELNTSRLIPSTDGGLSLGANGANRWDEVWVKTTLHTAGTLTASGASVLNGTLGVTGTSTLGVVNGGTFSSSDRTGSLDNFAPSAPGTGDLLYYDGAHWAKFARGTSGQVLTTTAGSTIGWAAGGGGSVPTGTGFTHITAGAQDAAARNPVLASADYANQGTTTTLLHGNAAGNPSFSAIILTADVTGVLPAANVGPAGSTFQYQYNNAGALSGGNLQQESSSVHSIQNGVTAQLFYIYGTYSGAGANYERVKAGWDGTYDSILTEQLGTGAPRHLRLGTTGSNADIYFATFNLNRWQVTSAGLFQASTDNTVTIGATRTTFRPTQIFTSKNGVLAGLIGTSTTDATVANTLTETTLLGTALGTYTLEASQINVAGKTVRVTVRGILSDTATPTLNLKFKVGGTAIVATGANALAGTLANNSFECVVDMTVRTTGASGTVIASGYFNYDNSTFGDVRQPMVITSAATVDLTTTKVIDVTATWGTAVPGNTLTSQIATIELLN